MSGNNRSNRFEGTHLDGGHIGTTAAKRLAGLIAPDDAQYPLSAQPTVAQLTNTALSSVIITEVGAEAANARSVKFQLFDANGEALARSRQVEVNIYDASGLLVLDTTANYEVVTGVGLTSSRNPHGFMITSGDGAGEITITDATGALSGVLYVSLEVCDGRSLGKSNYPVAFS